MTTFKESHNLSFLDPAKLFSCEGKVAIVTGGASGIGKACAEALAASGAKVAIVGLARSQPQQAAAEIQSLGLEAIGINADITKETELAAAIGEVQTRWGRIDIVLANAGASLDGALADRNSPGDYETSSSLAELDAMFTLHVRAVTHLAEIVLPIMAAGDGGSFTIMSSIAGLRGNQSISGYGVTKAANAQIARNIAVQWGSHGIRANSISPGVIDTDFAKPITGDHQSATLRRAKTPLKRFGTPTEIAGAVVWLSSAAGAFVSGQNIVIDGGTIISD